MQKLTLVIADKTRSSWSLRPWLFLRHHGVDFDEVRVALDRPDTRQRILEHSPSGKLPCLRHGSLRIWESLAICEYAAETFALPQAWPMDPAARAMARSMAAEMHAGFGELRRELPFDTQRPPVPQAYGEQAAADIARVRALWREARRLHGQGGEWLFGRFGIVDAMYAPVALRFHQYQVPLDGAEREYMFRILMHRDVQAWLEGANAEQPVHESPLERTAEIEPPTRIMVEPVVTAPPSPPSPPPPAAAPAPAPTPAPTPKPEPVASRPVAAAPLAAAPVAPAAPAAPAADTVTRVNADRNLSGAEVTTADLSAAFHARSPVAVAPAPQRYVDDPSEPPPLAGGGEIEATAEFSRTQTSLPKPAPAPEQKSDGKVKSFILPP